MSNKKKKIRLTDEKLCVTDLRWGREKIGGNKFGGEKIEDVKKFLNYYQD